MAFAPTEESRPPRGTRIRIFFYVCLALALSLAAPAARAEPPPDTLFDPLTDAVYPVVCGSDRTDAETEKLVALNAKLVAEAAAAVADTVMAAVRHGCLETIVVAGAGGNTSALCTAPDIAQAAADDVAVVARAVLENLEFVDDCIDHAEIEGSYERIDDVGDRLDEMGVRQIEEQLSGQKALASLYLPKANQGRLEDVRDIVDLWINNAEAAGANVKPARTHFDKAADLFAKGKYREAYLKYARAYKALK